VLIIIIFLKLYEPYHLLIKCNNYVNLEIVLKVVIAYQNYFIRYYLLIIIHEYLLLLIIICYYLLLFFIICYYLLLFIIIYYYLLLFPSLITILIIINYFS